jgi:hypothetical protein
MTTDITRYYLGAPGSEQPLSANDVSLSVFTEDLRKDQRLAGGNLVVYKIKQIGHWQWHYAWLPGRRAYVYDGGMSRNDLRALYEADAIMSFLVPQDSAPHAAYTVRFTANSWREMLLKRAGDCWFYEVYFELVQV